MTAFPLGKHSFMVLVLVVLLSLLQPATADEFSDSLSELIGSAQQEQAVELILEKPTLARRLFTEMELLALSGEGNPFLPGWIMNFIARTFEARLGDRTLADRLLLAGLLAPETSWANGPLEKVKAEYIGQDPLMQEGRELKLRLDLAVRLGSTKDATSILAELENWSKTGHETETAVLKSEALIQELQLLRSAGSQRGLEELGNKTLRFLERFKDEQTGERKLAITLLLAGGARKGKRPADLRTHLSAAQQLVSGQQGPAARRARFALKTYAFELYGQEKGVVSLEEVLRAHDEAWSELGELAWDYGRNWDVALDCIRYWAEILTQAGALEALHEDVERIEKLVQTLKTESEGEGGNNTWHFFTGPALPIVFTNVDLSLDLVRALRQRREFENATTTLAGTERNLASLAHMLNPSRESLGQALPHFSAAEDATSRLAGRYAEERGLLKYQEGVTNESLSYCMQQLAMALKGYQMSGDNLALLEVLLNTAQILRHHGRPEAALTITEEALKISRVLEFWPATAQALVLRAELTGTASDRNEANALVENYLNQLGADGRAADSARKTYLDFLTPVPGTEP
jgi:hypothetical protein